MKLKLQKNDLERELNPTEISKTVTGLNLDINFIRKSVIRF